MLREVPESRKEGLDLAGDCAKDTDSNGFAGLFGSKDVNCSSFCEALSGEGLLEPRRVRVGVSGCSSTLH